MALPNSLILASEVIGFISFTFTLLTALGVYADLIKTFRNAPSVIPIALGNLREEIIYEQQLCKQRLSAADAFHTFPGRKPGRKSHRELLQLISETVRQQWLEFCNIERNFLLHDRKPFKGGRMSDEDEDSADEKVRGRRRRGGRLKQNRPQPFLKSRMGWVEAGLSRDRQTYYNTDMAHRFAWWWKKDDVNNLAQQVQRIQIRRIERDSYEANVLVKRGLKIYGHRHKYNVYDSSDDSDEGVGRGRKNPRKGGSGSDSDDGGFGGVGGVAVNDDRKHINHHRTYLRRPHVTAHSRIRTASQPIRGRSEKGVIRRRASHHGSSSPPRTPSRRQRSSPTPASRVVGRLNGSSDRRTRPGRDREGGHGPVVYEYEIVDPGGGRVEYVYNHPPPPPSPPHEYTKT